MIEIGADTRDGIARAWLKDTLFMMEQNVASGYIHPDDAKTYKKDIKAVKRLLAFIGEQSA
jgi:hypothetical protein